MNTYIVIGAPGMGKSPFIRKLIEGRRCLVFDVANEYGDRVKYQGQQPVRLSLNNGDLRSRYTNVKDMKKFIALCELKRDTVCVFEEATGFFQGKTGLETTGLIINRYHTGNTYVFVFHSINSVPPRIMEMANYVVLFKTMDQTDTVNRKFGRIGPYFSDLQRKENGEKHIIKLL